MHKMHFDAARQREAINETAVGELSVRRAYASGHSARARRCQGVRFG